MRFSSNVSNISAALLKAQIKMGSATKGASNPFFRSKYADYGAVLEVVKEPLNEEGISILQSSYSDAAGHYVETVLLHTSGEFLSSGPLRLELAKVDMQSLGSSITYSRRYQLQALLGVPSADDDGEGAMARQPRTETAKRSTEPTSKPVEQTAPASPVPATEAPKASTSFRKPPRSSTAPTVVPTKPLDI